ncbi:MAG: hypothetical protein MRERC_1c076 [Mycoplasmataceae bacterium RC_NB112A]|nr:MAG: hypothetical protein MRERC_1c076 [Mycoplasmataceae bacterium RC_NB112A]
MSCWIWHCFPCVVCNIKYLEDFFGGETAYEGKICRSYLGKKHKGKTITISQPKSLPPPSYEHICREPYYRPEYERMQDSSGEKRY